MSFLAALGLLVGLISGGWSIYEFAKARRLPGAFLGILAVGILLGAFFLGNVSSLLANTGSSVSFTPTTSIQQTGIGSTPTQVLPTQPPSQIPTPTPPPPPSPGTVLCQADSSWNGWNGTSDWQVSNGMLLDNGTNNTPGGSITSPCQLPVADYAVEVTMQVVNFQSCCVDNLGIMLRSSSSGGYNVGVEIDSNHLAKITTDYTSLNNLATAHFDPGEGVHTYRAEVKGNTIKLFIDGGLLASATDNQYLEAGQVGLYSSFVQVDVTSFKVIAL